MEQKNITITIDDKIYKLTDDLLLCSKCSLYHFCKKLGSAYHCPARGLGGKSFVELKVEK